MQAKLEVGAVDDPLEREADRVAEQVMRMPDAAASPALQVGESHNVSCSATQMLLRRKLRDLQGPTLR